jgi:hypothetical protein
MPDGDRFYRRLSGTGRGWGTAYRFACNKSEASFLKGKALEAIADNLRRIEPTSLERAINILHTVFEDEKWQKRGLPFSDGDNYTKDNYTKLEQALTLSRFEGESVLPEVLKKAVLKVFLANRNACLTITEGQITENLGRTLAFEIMDAHFLSRVRDGIMEKQDRNFPEQVKWEQKLRKEIAEPSKKLLKGFVKGKQIRKPITRRIDKNATSNILSRSLNVLEGILRS